MPKRKNNPAKIRDSKNETQLIVSPEDKARFPNTAKPVVDAFRLKHYPGAYHFDRASVLLRTWGRTFQAVISQAGTRLLTGKYHDTECGIYKSEGGCRIHGVGELVLYDDHCSWDHGNPGADANLKKLANLIGHLVLEWEPCNPIESLLSSAALHIGDSAENLRKAVEKSSCGGVFGGDSLSRFFDVNPFSPPTTEHDEYLRWCKIHIEKQDPVEVDQYFADKALGIELLAKLKEKCRAAGNGYTIPMCCSPRRSKDGLGFWINTGSMTQIDGWKTQEEIEAFLAGNGVLRDNKSRGA